MTLNSDLSKHILSPRIIREDRTIQLMIGLNCRNHHQSKNDLCEDCLELMEYAHSRLLCCPFAPDKPTCAKCPVQCYKPKMRERIRQVMRYSGPRMLLYHPILTIRHLLDGRIEGRRKSKN
ncbi:MAG: nitrous oxide-stimulated promoter family protein [Leptolinea sp.]